MRIHVAAAVALAAMFASGSSAFAADLSPQPVMAAPVPAPTLWTGFYTGANLGGGWASTGAHSNTAIGGGQLGYNRQIGHVVLGGETDIQAISLRHSALLTNAIGNVITANTAVDYLGTVRGRVGYTFDRWLVYGTGGLAYTTISHNGVGVTGITGSYSQADDKVGFAVGAGAEWAFLDRWSAKAEYLFADFPPRTNTYTTTTPTIVINYTRLEFNAFRLGVNYRFAP